MKKVIILSFVFSLFLSCKDGNFEDLTSKANLEKENTQIANIEGVSLVNGRILKFNSPEIFSETVKNITSDKSFGDKFEEDLKSKNFNSLKDFYNSLTEEKLSDVFTKKQIPQKYKKYLKIVSDGEDFILEEIVPESFLQMVANTDKEFIIENHKFVIEDGYLQVYKNYQDKNPKSDIIKINRKEISVKNKNARPNGVQVENEFSYIVNGNHYKLKAIGYESSPVTYLFNFGNVNLWETFTAGATHYKRFVWIYWKGSVPNLKVNGVVNLWQATSVPGQYIYVNDSFTQSCSNQADCNRLYYFTPNQGGVKSYNFTASCWGIENNNSIQQVSVSNSL